MQHPKMELDDGFSIKIMDEYDDADAVFAIIKESFHAGPYSGPLDEESLYQMMTSLRDGEIVQGVLFVLLHYDLPVGYLAATKSTHPFFPNRSAAVEIGWFVYPDYRTKHSMKLLDAFEEWAKLTGATRAAVAHYGHNEEAKKVSAFYKRKKYKPIEIVYAKELN